jgi:hypothetical protein
MLVFGGEKSSDEANEAKARRDGLEAGHLKFS